MNGLFVDGGSRRALERVYRRFLGTQINYRDLVNSSKKMIMLVSLSSEINALSHQLERIAKRNRRYRDFTLNSLTFAIREVIACLPVYRTYISGPDDVAQRDKAYVETAVARAKRRNPRTAVAVFDFIRDTLLLRNIDEFREEDRPALISFAMKFQQMTGPVMAKGVEDTAFYVYNRLLSLNEVGGNPERLRSVGGSLPPPERPSASNAGPAPCSPPQPTTRNAARTCARASTCCRRCPVSGTKP